MTGFGNLIRDQRAAKKVTGPKKRGKRLPSPFPIAQRWSGRGLVGCRVGRSGLAKACARLQDAREKEIAGLAHTYSPFMCFSGVNF